MNYGTTKKDGKIYQLTENAWIAYYMDIVRYHARALDVYGCEYMVSWDLADSYDADEMDEDCACDWDNATTVTIILV